MIIGVAAKALQSKSLLAFIRNNIVNKKGSDIIPCYLEQTKADMKNSADLSKTI